MSGDPSADTADKNNQAQAAPPLKSISATPSAAVSPPEPAWAKPSFAIISLILFVLALFITFMSADKTAFDLVIGAIISNVTNVVGYYFGSSSGSTQKTAILAAQTPSGGT